MNSTLISVLSAVAAAAWSVLTWQSEREKERDIKRDEMSAHFINALIMAAQDLQNMLFRVLEQDDLAHYRLKYPEPVEPASRIAIEFLYLLSSFFAWELLTLRFGPYTRDPQMIKLMAQIRVVTESRSRFPDEAFRFMLSDRLALAGSAVIQIGENPSGPLYAAVPFFKFEEDISNEKSERARLYRSDEVRLALTAIDRAIRGEPLQGRERLAALQNLLVDLVVYLEEKEGFRVHMGERGKATVLTEDHENIILTSEDIHVLHQVPGRVRLGILPLRGDATFASLLQSKLQKLDHVKSVRINIGAACAVIEYSSSVSHAEFMQSLLARFGGQSSETSKETLERQTGKKLSANV